MAQKEKDKQELFVNTPPPKDLYIRLNFKFGVDWEKGVIFTYNNKIYSKYPISEDLVKHELVHIRQQNDFIGGSDAWWNKYLEDKEFRLNQELEAYRKQFRWSKANIKDRNRLFNILRHSAIDLSSSMYGDILSYEEALKEIQK